MPAIRRTFPPETSTGPDREPPYYEATCDLYVSSPEAGVLPALAYRTGDRVVPDVVEANGWAEKVRIPDIYEGQLSSASPAPEATAPVSQSAGTTGTED